MFYLVKTPAWLRWLSPPALWHIPTKEKVLYLTFDDGPIPELTPWILDTLQAFGAKATFFCVGDNVRKHSAIFERTLAAGHAVGNHTFHHLNGWKTPLDTYLKNIEQCREQVNSTLFRPPYGRLTRQQHAALSPEYQVVMWDVLSGDFDPGITPEKCLNNVVRHARPGSVVVLHDNIKATANIRYALPRILEVFSERGYRFEAITSSSLIS